MQCTCISEHIKNLVIQGKINLYLTLIYRATNDFFMVFGKYLKMLEIYKRNNILYHISCDQWLKTMYVLSNVQLINIYEIIVRPKSEVHWINSIDIVIWNVELYLCTAKIKQWIGLTLLVQYDLRLWSFCLTFLSDLKGKSVCCLTSSTILKLCF